MRSPRKQKAQNQRPAVTHYSGAFRKTCRIAAWFCVSRDRRVASRASRDRRPSRAGRRFLPAFFPADTCFQRSSRKALCAVTSLVVPSSPWLGTTVFTLHQQSSLQHLHPTRMVCVPVAASSPDRQFDAQIAGEENPLLRQECDCVTDGMGRTYAPQPSSQPSRRRHIATNTKRRLLHPVGREAVFAGPLALDPPSPCPWCSARLHSPARADDRDPLVHHDAVAVGVIASGSACRTRIEWASSWSSSTRGGAPLPPRRVRLDDHHEPGGTRPSSCRPAGARLCAQAHEDVAQAAARVRPEFQATGTSPSALPAEPREAGCVSSRRSARGLGSTARGEASSSRTSSPASRFPRNAQHFRRFFDAQPPKESQLDDLRLPFVLRGQRPRRLVDGDHPQACRWRPEVLVEGDAMERPATLLVFAAPRRPPAFAASGGQPWRRNARGPATGPGGYQRAGGRPH